MRNATFKRVTLFVLVAVFAFCFAMASAMLFKTEASAFVYPTNKVELYQLAPSQNLYEGYVIKTPNDELVVIDGGASTGESAAYIDAALTAISGREDYTVKYWFLSHAHDDHISELAKILSGETIDFTIENIVFDFPTFKQNGTEWYAEEAPNCKDVSSGALTNLKAGLANYAEKKGIVVEGESYYDDLNGAIVNADKLANGPMFIEVDGVKFEILQTWSKSDTSVNSNSMIIRAWIDGQSVMFLNDATIESGNRLIATYGREFLKSDIVQMAHHGQKGTAKNVYDAVDAKVRLWPCHIGVWNGGDGYQTEEVRTWVGLPASSSDFEQTPYDIVSALCASPTDNTSATDWTAVLDGMKLDLPYVYAYDHDFFMNEGASIRTTAQSTGMRFSATLTSYDPDTEYGFVIAPKSWLDALNVTEDRALALITEYGTAEEDGVILLKSGVHQVDQHFEIKGSISNVLDKNIGLDFVAIAFSYKDGVYTDAYVEDMDGIARSVAKVATAAFNDNANGGYEYTNDELDVIEDFMQISTGGEAFAFDFVSDESMTVHTTKTLAYTTNLPNVGIAWSSSNPEIISVKDGVVTAHAVGSAEITAVSAGITDTCTVTSVAETDAIISFSDKGSEGVAGPVPSSIRASRNSGGLVESEWLESYKGANGVLKITSKAGVTGVGVSDVRIELPVPVSNGATIKFLIEDTDATYFYFYDGTEKIKDYYSDETIAIPDTLKNCWAVEYIPYADDSEDKSAINILIQGGSVNYEHVFYIDIIEDGDTTANYGIEDYYGYIIQPLAENLEEPYLADFSSDEYESLVLDQRYATIGATDSAVYATSELTAERLETFNGETNVLKVTATTTNGGFSIRLPKEIGSDGFTIRFMIAEMSDLTQAIFQILNPFTSASQVWQVYDSRDTKNLTAKIGVWNTVYVSSYTSVPSGYDEQAPKYVDFRTYTKTSSTKVIYIDYIAAGDVAEQIAEERKSALPGKLTEPYLADFSEAAYTYLVDYSSNSVNKAASIDAQYLDSHTDENGSIEKGVLKITAKAASNGRGNILIKLPKVSTSGIVTVKFMVPTCKSSYCGIIDPGTNANRIVAFSKTTTWQYVVVDQSDCENDRIEFLFANTASAVNEVYIGCIAEGDQVEYLKEQAEITTNQG